MRKKWKFVTYFLCSFPEILFHADVFDGKLTTVSVELAGIFLEDLGTMR